MFDIKGLSITALFIAISVSSGAAQTVTKTSVFATGGAVGGTGPQFRHHRRRIGLDRIRQHGVSTGGGSSDDRPIQPRWRRRAHVFDFRPGRRAEVQPRHRNSLGAAEQRRQRYALADQSHDQYRQRPLSYASPPYVYGSTSGRGYDDVAFLDGKVYLSYTNPVNPTDPVLQKLNQGNNPSGTLTTTDLVTASQRQSTDAADTDSLKSTWYGDLVLTSEGDGPGTGNPVGEYTLISHPAAVDQTVTNIAVTDAKGDNVTGMDDVVFPSRSAGTLYVTDTGANKVYALSLTGLDPNTPIIALGDLGGVDEVATVNPMTGVIEKTLFTGVSVHGMEFVAAPEPATWAMILLGFAGLGIAGRRASGRRVAATA